MTTKMQITNDSAFEACGQAVLCLPYVPELSQLIEIPDHVMELELTREMRAVVIDIGKGCWKDEAEPRARVGDRVLISKFSGAIVKCPLTGKLYRICNDRDIFTRIKADVPWDNIIPQDPILRSKKTGGEAATAATHLRNRE